MTPGESRFVYSEALLSRVLCVSRKALRGVRREKTAAGRCEERDGEVFYDVAGVALVAVTLGLSVGGEELRGLLEKTRGGTTEAQGGGVVEKNAPPVSPDQPVPVEGVVLRQYPNPNFWRVSVNGRVVDVYEKRSWRLGPRKRVLLVPVEGRRYFRLA